MEGLLAAPRFLSARDCRPFLFSVQHTGQLVGQNQRSNSVRRRAEHGVCREELEIADSRIGQRDL